MNPEVSPFMIYMMIPSLIFAIAICWYVEYREHTLPTWLQGRSMVVTMLSTILFYWIILISYILVTGRSEQLPALSVLGTSATPAVSGVLGWLFFLIGDKVRELTGR